MIRGNLQFTVRIAFCCVLHRCKSQDIYLLIVVQADVPFNKPRAQLILYPTFCDRGFDGQGLLPQACQVLLIC